MTVTAQAAAPHGRIVTKEHLMEQVKKLTLLSNTLMNTALEDIPACQHVLRIVTGIPDLIVRQARTQYRISRTSSRDAVLDVLAEDGHGRLYNLEIQRADTQDHARRVRFYGAMTDSEYLMKGASYKDMPEVHIIYISETDIWKSGKTVCRIKKLLDGALPDIPYDDGLHFLYINAEVDDGSDVAGLMRYFKTADPMDMSQGDLSRRVHYLKCDEKGVEALCKIEEELVQYGREAGLEEGKVLGLEEGRREVIRSMASSGMEPETIARVSKISISQIQQWLENTATDRSA